MLIFGLLLIALGGALLYVRKRTEARLLEILFVKTTSVSDALELQHSVAEEIGPGGFAQQMEFKGVVACDTPLTSELAQQPCVYYSMSVEERYEEDFDERDAQGSIRKRTRTGSTIVASNTRHTRFLLDDGSGCIPVDLHGASIDAVKALERFEAYNASVGTLRAGTFTFQIATPTPKRRVLGYHYRESIIPVGQQLYALGEVHDGSGEAVLRFPSDPKSPFIVSVKSEEELVRSKRKSSRHLLIGAVVCFIIGALLLFL